MKQRNIDAAVFTAYLLQGIGDKYDADQWGGHIGLVQDLALHGRAIADQLRMLQDLHPDADYPGVMEYELIEPLGRWIADNAAAGRYGRALRGRVDLLGFPTLTERRITMYGSYTRWIMESQRAEAQRIMAAKRTKKVEPSSGTRARVAFKNTASATRTRFTVYGRGADPVRYGVLNCATGEETPAELTCAEAHTLAEQLKGARS